MVHAPRRLDALLVDRHAAFVVPELGCDNAEVGERERKVPVVLEPPRERRALLPPVSRGLAVAATVLDAPEQDQQPIALVLVDLACKQRERTLGAGPATSSSSCRHSSVASFLKTWAWTNGEISEDSS